jgi:hexosaminidase
MLAIALLLLLSSSSPRPPLSLVPLPLKVHERGAVGAAGAVINASELALELTVPDACDALLRRAFARTKRALAPRPGMLPYMRVQYPSSGATGTAAAATSAAAANATDGWARFRTLRIVLPKRGAAPDLQHGVDESYSLELRHGTGGVLRAKTQWGALRGLETLLGLVHWGDRHATDGLPTLPRGLLPLRLQDRPRFGWRGLLMDTARHFLPLPQLLRVVDGMAALKLNVLHWHIVDAQSFPFQSVSLPELSRRGAYHPTLVYTHADVRAVVGFARERGIRVVPEIDMPGHTYSWGLGYANLTVRCPAHVARDRDGAEHGVDSVSLHPLREGTYAAVAALLEEVSALFPDGHLHVGADEVSAACLLEDEEVRAWVDKSGYRRDAHATWAHELQARFTSRVLAMLQKLGKRAVLWDEALEAVPVSVLEPFAPLLQVWRWWVPRLNERVTHSGLQAVVSRGFYLDHHDSWSKMYQVSLPAGAHVLGGEACSWAEHADGANVDHRVFARLGAVAERLWSSEKVRDVADAKARLMEARCRLRRRGLRVGPLAPDHCSLGSAVDEGRSTADGERFTAPPNREPAAAVRPPQGDSQIWHEAQRATLLQAHDELAAAALWWQRSACAAAALCCVLGAQLWRQAQAAPAVRKDD